MDFNFQQKEPTTEQLRAQLVAMMNQLGVPVPPTPDIEQFRGHGPDTVHETIHTLQSNSLADSVQMLAAKLTEAQESIRQRAYEDNVEADQKLVEQIELTLNTVSANSLKVAKTVLDLQEIEDALREADAPEIGGYL